MQPNKEKDNPGLNRQSPAQIVANSFNRRAYTREKMVQLERSLMKHRTIPCTKAGMHIYVESLDEV